MYKRIKINLLSLNFLFLCRFEAFYRLYLLFCLNLHNKVLLCYTISYDKAIVFLFLFFRYKPYNMSTRSDTKLFTEENYLTNCDHINWLKGLFLQKLKDSWTAMGAIVLRVRWIGRIPMWAGETASGCGRGWRDMWNYRLRGRLGTCDLWQICGFMLVTQCQSISRATLFIRIHHKLMHLRIFLLFFFNSELQGNIVTCTGGYLSYEICRGCRLLW